MLFRSTTGSLVGAISFHQVASMTDQFGNSIYFNYQAPVSGFNWPLLSSISTQSAGGGTVLLSIERPNDGSGSISQISDCYGRSVFYNVKAMTFTGICCRRGGLSRFTVSGATKSEPTPRR